MAIEIEFRGPLIKNEFKKLLSFFQKEADFVKRMKRKTFVFFMNDKTLDLKVRTTDGVPGNKYRGQRQTFFLVEFLGTDDDIKIDTKELKAYYWVTKEELFRKIDSNHPLFKGYRKLVEKLLRSI